MHVGISLLTLVPRISGGSETYAREARAALSVVGASTPTASFYRASLPTWKVCRARSSTSTAHARCPGGSPR